MCCPVEEIAEHVIKNIGNNFYSRPNRFLRLRQWVFILFFIISAYKFIACMLELLYNILFSYVNCCNELCGESHLRITVYK